MPCFNASGLNRILVLYYYISPDFKTRERRHSYPRKALHKCASYVSIPNTMERPISYREEANAITVWAFRNGYIEQLHRGKYSELLENPGLQRVT